MTGRTAIATAHWRRLDMQGTDRCTLSRLDNGWMLVGQAIWHDDGMDNVLTYDVRCAPDWQSLSADIGGEVNGHDVALRLLRVDDGWVLNDAQQACGPDCTDLDLSFTPATNLLPMRRLDLSEGDPATVKAAWLKPELGSVAQLDQVYTRLSGDKVLYASPNHRTELTVHSSGFVTQYPDLWEGWVDA